MKLIISIIFMLLSSSIWAISEVSGILRLRDINVMPEKLLQRLDSLDKNKLESDYKIQYLRSYAYYSLSRFSVAYEYALSAFKDEDIRKDTAVFDRTLILLGENAIFSYRIEDACKIVSNGLQYAYNRSASNLIANMLFMEGLLYRKVDNLKKSYEYFDKAIRILSKNSDSGSRLRISQIKGFLCEAYISDNMLDEAWNVALKRGSLLKLLREEGESHMLVDKQEADFYSKVAFLAHKQGRYIVANEYYEKFLTTDFSKTNLGLLDINDYLLEIGKYRDVIENNKRFFLGVDLDDAISVVYQRALLQSARAYQGEGMYESAYKALSKLSEIKERHRLDINRQLVLNRADTTELLQYKLDLHKAQHELESRQKLIVLFIALILIMLVLLLWLLYERRTLNKKNKKISSLLVELSDARSSADGVNSEDDTESDPDYKIFLRFDEKVREEHLYLKYQLQRDDFARIMGVDRNRFAAIIKEYTCGGNLNSYLNDMRLEHSIYLFKNYPEMSIQEIGDASALPSSTTFYRLFKEKFGLSPKAFRKQL